ncbi:MAG: TVP38/TMEM64 family protein [Solirubrobacterales bacterium]
MRGDQRAGDGGPHAWEPPPLTGVLITLAGIALLAVLVLAVEPLRTGVGDAVSGDTESLRDELRDLGFSGALITLALALVHAVVWYPAEILDAAAGFVYGFWVALPLVMAGWLLNAVVAHQVGRHAARPLLYRVAGRERYLRLERLVGAGGVTLLLAMRLVPIVPFSLFSIAAGSARVPMARFLWTTAVGYLPITAIFVYLGSRLEELSLTDPVLWAGLVVLVILLLLTRRLARMLSGTPAPERHEEAR